MQETKELRRKALSGFVWQFSLNFFRQLFSFIVTVILARCLTPDDYGVVALAGMFNVLVGIFVSGSMGTALIQKKDADELDFNTVFYSSLFMSFIIYVVVYLSSTYVADIYHNKMICPVMRVMALSMPIGALAMVQNAVISRNMEFKKFFKASLFGQIIAAIAGIVMAYNGFGPWALVAQTMIDSITNTFVMFHLVTWHPKLMYSFERFKRLFSFAWKKTAASFIGTFCSQLKGYLIGGKYTASDLAYFNRGEGLPLMFANNISGTIDAVLFPALSKVNDDYTAVRKGMRRSMMTYSYLLTPIFIGLASVSDRIIPLVYGNQWQPAVPFMQVSCLSCIVGILSGANLQALTVIGRTDQVLKLEMYKKPIMIIILFAAVFISPLAIAIGMLLYSFYVLCINTIPNKRLLDYSLLDQIKDVKDGIILSLVMGIIVSLMGSIITDIYVALFLQIIFGVLFYILLSHILKLEAYEYVREMLISYFK